MRGALGGVCHAWRGGSTGGALHGGMQVQPDSQGGGHAAALRRAGSSLGRRTRPFSCRLAARRHSWGERNAPASARGSAHQRLLHQRTRRRQLGEPGKRDGAGEAHCRAEVRIEDRWVGDDVVVKLPGGDERWGVQASAAGDCAGAARQAAGCPPAGSGPPALRRRQGLGELRPPVPAPPGPPLSQPQPHAPRKLTSTVQSPKLCAMPALRAAGAPSLRSITATRTTRFGE